MISNDDLILEMQIIGSLIIDKSAIDLLPRLKEDDFLDATNRKVIKAMHDLTAAKQDIDLFTVHKRTSIPISTIANITDIIASTANVESNIKVLKDKSNRRKLINKANKIIQMAKDNTLDMDTIKNNAMREIEELEDTIDDEVVTLGQAMLETIELLQKRYENRGDTSFYIGIPKFDEATAGLHQEELTTIGARPGVGKTILGMQIAQNIAKKKRKVMYTSLEMSVTQLCERIISSSAKVNLSKLRTGNIESDKEWTNVYNTANENSIDNFLLDKTSRTIQHIRTKLRKHKPDLVVIDYLQLLRSSEKHYSREQEVATITRDLKLMTLEFKIPIVILSQLNRNAEGNRPSMADLRESGAIEQDSDNIIFLHEPNGKDIDNLIKNGIYSNGFFKALEDNNRKLSQLIIEKQRNGPVGTIDAIKAPEIMKFIEIDKS
ncbi:DnaB-like helicase C-terminal domain-containing protein [uncultured Tissierella sp.]|uniref:replicative DNA helicase n=1 Tax=uncultured Tissierella sp. TaxID=448160 RepID=UPI0028060812|nr:DnaB-like helicase C-terminal domain-containing protein [uncultured Tissierella sp.]MDU5081989.1 DnaB-like helicase C-terminal domain-containing protein [Bacillota bacterium]